MRIATYNNSSMYVIHQTKLYLLKYGCPIQYMCVYLDSPYGELKFAPPKAYFIDLRQIRANLLQIFSKIINIHKMHVQNIQGCHFLRKKSPCGTLHNIAKGLVPLFAVNHSAICRYLPLAFPLFAAICR